MAEEGITEVSPKLTSRETLLLEIKNFPPKEAKEQGEEFYERFDLFKGDPLIKEITTMVLVPLLAKRIPQDEVLQEKTDEQLKDGVLGSLKKEAIGFYRGVEDAWRLRTIRRFEKMEWEKLRDVKASPSREMDLEGFFMGSVLYDGVVAVQVLERIAQITNRPIGEVIDQHLPVIERVCQVAQEYKLGRSKPPESGKPNMETVKWLDLGLKKHGYEAQTAGGMTGIISNNPEGPRYIKKEVSKV